MAATVQKPPVVDRYCVHCHLAIALSERGVQKAARNGVEVGELHGDCLDPWKTHNGPFVPVQGGDNGGGQRQFVRHYQSQRR